MPEALTSTGSKTIADDLAALAVPIDELHPLAGNPRRGDVTAVARSLARFGQHKPVVAQRGTGMVIAGNHTVEAARSLGWPAVAVVWVDDDDVTAAARSLADNRTAELGGYDEPDLVAMIDRVRVADAELFGATGWAGDDLAALLARVQPVVPAALSDPDDVPAVPSVPVTCAGDVWELGPHRLVCGDCRDAAVVDRAVDGRRVNVAFTSPPYAEQRTYDASSGFRPIPPDEYVDWFDAVQANVARVLADDGSWFVNIKPAADGLDTDLYVLDLVAAHVRRWGWHFATEFCWERVGVPKQVVRRFKNQFEPVYQFARGSWKIRADHVRHRSDNAIVPIGVGAGDTSWDRHQGGGAFFKPQQIGEPGWAYPGNRLPTFTGSHEALGHAAAFPAGLPAWFARAYSDPGDVVFDPFCGSGSTIIAAGREGRVGVGIEISPAYCDVICARYERHTGIVPVRNGEQVSFVREAAA